MSADSDLSLACPSPSASLTSPLRPDRHRLVFMGTAELACASLNTLATDPAYVIEAVVTQPDRPRGRALKLQPTPVKQVALQYHLPVLQPLRARHPEFVRQIADLRPDLIVVAAYGQILPKELLAIPPHGSLNVHTSLLPKYRGAAPIQWAILNGDSETGVTLMRINEQLDAGDMLAQSVIPIHPTETAQELHDRLAQLGAELLKNTLPTYLRGECPARPQPAEGVSYARKITKSDGQLDWTSPALHLFNRVRAFTPWPGTFTYVTHQPRPFLLKIVTARRAQGAAPPGTVLPAPDDCVRVACGEQALDLLVLQREGGRPLAAREFLRGCPLAVGTRMISLP